MKFRGVMTALVTPMQQGSIDEGGLRNLVRRQLEAGVKGLVPCGSTGEGATLTDDEQAYVISIVADEVLGRVPVVAGVGARSTHGACAQAQAAEKAGADAVLVVTPAYNKPTQTGLESHFVTVAENCGLPICLYNVPGRTGVDLLPRTVERLAEHEKIVAIKEATGSMERSAELRRRVPAERLALMSGDDFTVLPFMAQGGDGVISVVSNIMPAQMVEMLSVISWGNLEKARELAITLLPVIRSLFNETNPIPVKTAAAWLSLVPTSELRLPLTPLGRQAAEQLELALIETGLQPNRQPGAISTLGPSILPDRDQSEARTVEYADRLIEPD
jgi:4-hydroxy-tetrahydrodipicolinate synthase